MFNRYLQQIILSNCSSPFGAAADDDDDDDDADDGDDDNESACIFRRLRLKDIYEQLNSLPHICIYMINIYFQLYISLWLK